MMQRLPLARDEARFSNPARSPTTEAQTCCASGRAKVAGVVFQKIECHEHHRHIGPEANLYVLAVQATLQFRKRQRPLDRFVPRDDFSVQNGPFRQRACRLHQLGKRPADQFVPADQKTGWPLRRISCADAVPFPFQEPVIPCPQRSQRVHAADGASMNGYGRSGSASPSSPGEAGCGSSWKPSVTSSRQSNAR